VPMIRGSSAAKKLTNGDSSRLASSCLAP
jgi:hypothetical protein